MSAAQWHAVESSCCKNQPQRSSRQQVYSRQAAGQRETVFSRLNRRENACRNQIITFLFCLSLSRNLPTSNSCIIFKTQEQWSEHKQTMRLFAWKWTIKVFCERTCLRSCFLVSSTGWETLQVLEHCKSECWLNGLERRNCHVCNVQHVAGHPRPSALTMGTYF